MVCSYINVYLILTRVVTRNKYFSKDIVTLAIQTPIQYSPAISNFALSSNFFPGPFSIYPLLPYKVSRYLELRYLELIFWSLKKITATISNFSESVGHRNANLVNFRMLFFNL